MMKEVRFKIVESEDYQVLVEKREDHTDDDKTVYQVAIVFHHPIARCEPILGYSSAEKRDAFFDKITDEQVQNIVSQTLKFLEGEGDVATVMDEIENTGTKEYDD